MPAICTPFHPLASSCLNTFLQKLFVFLPLLQLCIPLSLTVFLLHNCASRLSSVLSATLLCKPWVRGSLPWYEASCFRHIDPGKLLSYAAALHRTVQNTACMDTVSIYRLYIYIGSLTTSHWDTSQVLVTQGPALQYASESGLERMLQRASGTRPPQTSTQCT